MRGAERANWRTNVYATYRKTDLRIFNSHGEVQLARGTASSSKKQCRRREHQDTYRYSYMVPGSAVHVPDFGWRRDWSANSSYISAGSKKTSEGVREPERGTRRERKRKRTGSPRGIPVVRARVRKGRREREKEKVAEAIVESAAADKEYWPLSICMFRYHRQNLKGTAEDEFWCT